MRNIWKEKQEWVSSAGEQEVVPDGWWWVVQPGARGNGWETIPSFQLVVSKVEFKSLHCGKRPVRCIRDLLKAFSASSEPEGNTTKATRVSESRHHSILCRYSPETIAKTNDYWQEWEVRSRNRDHPSWFCAWRKEAVSISEKVMPALHDEPPFLTYMPKFGPPRLPFAIPDTLSVIFTLKGFVEYRQKRNITKKGASES